MNNVSRILEELQGENTVKHFPPETVRDKYMFQAGQQDMLLQLKRKALIVPSRRVYGKPIANEVYL